jgi:hypothetical protein
MGMTIDAFRLEIDRLDAEMHAALDARGAIGLQAESNFVGYIREEPDGQFSNEIHAWGVNHGKCVYGESIDAVQAEALRLFG